MIKGSKINQMKVVWQSNHQDGIRS